MERWFSDWLITSDCKGGVSRWRFAPGTAPGIKPGEFGNAMGSRDALRQNSGTRRRSPQVSISFGGVSDSDLIVKLVREGRTREAPRQ